MKKLFDIPIYALTPGELNSRVESYKAKLSEITAGADPEVHELVVDQETFPARCWDYNHIVGYIRISATSQDIVFDVFRPKPAVERYSWKAHKKVFLYNVHANGTHFYTGNMKTNEEIRAAAAEMLTWVVKDFFPARCCADRSCFDALNPHLDYLAIIGK